MSKRPGPNKANLKETRGAFIDIARHEFATYGYMQASTARMVEKSGMARGSLYYHFGDKQGLFKAVYEHMLFQALQIINNLEKDNTDPWQYFLASSHTYLDLCMEKDFRKITLMEAQAALSFEDRYRIYEKTLYKKLAEILQKLLDKGFFPGHSVQTLSVFIYGLLGEVGRTFDFSSNLERDRKKYGNLYEKSMHSLKEAGVGKDH